MNNIVTSGEYPSLRQRRKVGSKFPFTHNKKITVWLDSSKIAEQTADPPLTEYTTEYVAYPLTKGNMLTFLLKCKNQQCMLPLPCGKTTRNYNSRKNKGS